MDKEKFKIVRRGGKEENDVTAPKDRKTTEAVFASIKYNYRSNAAVFYADPSGEKFTAQETSTSEEIKYSIERVNQ